jgi:hypothetical protein
MTLLEILKLLFNKFRMSNKVKESLVFDGKFTIQLLNDQDKYKGRNVIGLDIDGNEIWRIDPDPLNPSFNYVSILNQNGKLVAINFSTNQVELDYKTGKVISNRWVK